MPASLAILCVGGLLVNRPSGGYGWKRRPVDSAGDVADLVEFCGCVVVGGAELCWWLLGLDI